MKTLLSLLLSSGIAMAHHGQDFFVTLDSRVPAYGGFAAFTTAAAGKDDFPLETGVIAGLGAGLAAGFTVDFNDSNSFQANGITPIIQWSAPLGNSPLQYPGATNNNRIHIKYIKYAIVATIAAFSISCDRQKAAIEDDKDARQEMLENHEDQVEANADLAKAKIEAEKDRMQAQIEAEKKKAEADADAAKAEVDSQDQ